MSQKLCRVTNVILTLSLVLSSLALTVSAAPARATVEPEAMAPAAVVDNQEDAPAQGLVLTSPYVSDPVSPAKTMGRSSQPTAKSHTEEPQVRGALPVPGAVGTLDVFDPVVQRAPVAPNMPTPITNWEGISATGVYPPDTDGQVGPNHYVQIVNSGPEGSQIRVWDKTGTELYDFGMNSMWPDTDPCNIYGNGDPVVLYDQLADRWILTQFALPQPFYECFAVSVGPTPTDDPADWYLYSFEVHPNKMNDYPKLGVWPDGYYMSANQFAPGWAGAGVWVFERDAMLTGSPATFQYFDLEPRDPAMGGLLPSNLMGDTLPPAGSPNYFATSDVVNSVMRIFEFSTDWGTPANTTFTEVANVPVAPFDNNMCSGARSCIPQPDTDQGVDAIADRIMMHLWYRNFGTHESLVTNQTVDVGDDHAGLRWYEFRNPGANAYVMQQGTFAPDEHHRWMGSIAMDRMGNMALGYSIASGTMYPSIRYTGRLAGDPLGVMAQGEETIINGSGSQTGPAGRWGDYSAMSVDPVDDCTFWYTQEYYETTSAVGWQTRVASFVFPECLAETGVIDGSVLAFVMPTFPPIEKAKVEAQQGMQNYVAFSQADGSYGFTAVPTGTYDMTASAYGYASATQNNIDVFESTTTTVGFVLTQYPTYTVEGNVTDAIADWPLYASIDIEAEGYEGDPLWTDPVSGYYSVTLAGGTVHTFTVAAWTDGYSPTVSTVGPLVGDTIVDFALDANLGVCAAPGYVPAGSAYMEDFESNDGGYSGMTDWEWGTPTSWPDDCASGDNCWGTNLSGLYSPNTNQTLTSTLIDLSSYPAGTLLAASWQQAWYMEPGFDYASAEININGGGWTEVWISSSEDNDWTPMSYDISDAAGGNVQFRWRLTSDGGYETEGYYIDDVEITYGCGVTPGGLVVGNVYDDNTMDALVDATVSNESGETTLTAAVPDDPAVDDGFYTLFSPSGSQTFTGTMMYYEPDTASVSVVLSDTVAQDFYLPAGMLSYERASYAVTLELGMSTTETFTLTNDGGVAAMFELIEVPDGFTPTARAPKSPNKKLHKLLPYANPVVRASAPASSGLRQPMGDITLTHSLSQTILAGNSVACSTDGITITDNSYFRVFDLAAFGITGDFAVTNVQMAIQTANAGVGGSQPATVNLYALDGNLAWANLTLLGTADTTVADQTLSFINVPVTGRALSGSTLVVEFFTPDGDPDGNGLWVGSNNLGQTAPSYIAASSCAIAEPTDLAAIGYPDMHIVMNVSGNEVAPITDFVPWLSEDPISGTLALMSSQQITLTFDAGVPEVDQPGEYYAELEIEHETPYELLNVPMTMTVTPPPTWGRVMGTITGLGYCDITPAALEGAEVLIENGSVVSVTSDANGDYSLWIEAGTYTVTVSAAGHASVVDMMVDVTAQMTTTQDFELRSIEPCISVSPTAIESTLLEGDSEMQTLSLLNDGAGASDFEFGPLTVLAEGFEDGLMPPPGGWEVITTHSVRNWSITLNPDFIHSGSYAAWVNYDTPEASDEWLLTPDLDLSGVANATLDFWAISDTDWCPNGGVGANMLLHVTDSGGTPTATVWDMCNDEDPDWDGPFQYRPVMVDLSAYDGQMIRLAWQYVGIDGQSFGLDDVMLTGVKAIPWLSLDPITGTVSADSSFMVDVTFTALPTMAPGVYTDTLTVNNDDAVNDEISVPVTLTVVVRPPETTWDKDVYVNDNIQDIDNPITVVPSDTIVIVDQVDITFTGNITFTLVEEWDDSLELTDYELPPGSLAMPGIDVMTDTNSLTWTVMDLPSDWSYVITKTFHVAAGEWDVDLLTETLTVEGATMQPDPIVLMFEHGGVNSPPVAVDDSYVTSQDTVLTVPAPGVLSNDTDAELDPLTAMLDAGPSNGMVDLGADGSFVYTPTAGFNGTDSFTYHANDGTDDSNVATVTISVSPVTTCTEVASVTLSVDPGTLYVGNAISFSADIAPDNAGKPYSYTVDYDDGTTPVMGSSSDDPLALSHTYASSGTFDVMISVRNCDMTVEEAVSDTLQVDIEMAGYDVYLPLIAANYDGG
jgi:hypothetical protein